MAIPKEPEFAEAIDTRKATSSYRFPRTAGITLRYIVIYPFMIVPLFVSRKIYQGS